MILLLVILLMLILTLLVSGTRIYKDLRQKGTTPIMAIFKSFILLLPF